MATFSPTEVQCEDPQCPFNGTSEDVASYGIRKTINLCPHCAERKNNEGIILPRGDQRGTTFCIHHRDRVANWFCTSHNDAVCQECKSSPNHQACTLKDVEDVFKEAASQLKESLKQVRQKHGDLRNQEAYLQRRISKMDTHFKRLEDALKSTQKEKERKRGEGRRSGDGQNRRTRNEGTGAGVEDFRGQDENEAKQCLEQINEGQRRANVLMMKVKDQLNQCLNDTLAIAERMEQLLRDVNRGLGDIKSTLGDVEGILRLSVNTHLMEVAEKFARGIRYERKCGIDIVQGCRRSMWYLSDTITLPKKINNPLVRYIDSKEVVVLDINCKDVYRVNLQDNNVELIDIDMPIADLISHNGKIICQDDGGLSLRVYSRQWQYIQDISLPGQIFEKLAVGSSENLLVLARERRAFVIKPTEMTIHQKHFIEINIDSVKEFVALSSGHIIVKQGKATFNVLGKKGTEIKLINQKNWIEASVCADRRTGTVYVLYLDKTNSDFAVCRFSVAGAVVEEEVHDLRDLLDRRLKFHLDVFESKKLYICNGNKLFVFTMISANDP